MKIVQNLIRLFILFSVILVSGLWYRWLRLRTTRNVAQEKTRFGRRLCAVFQFLGPSYIKLGQFLSSRPDLVGYEISDQLEKLQDRLKPFAFKSVQKTIEQQLYGEISQFFLEFEQEARAAASIAQVHQARTIEGDLVAVKVLRPGIEGRFRRDLSMFYMLAFIAESFSASARRMRLKKVVNQLRQIVEIEMNLRLEAAAADKIRQNLSQDQDIIVPKIHWKYTTNHILTSEWCHGIAVNDRKALRQKNYNIPEIVRKLSVCFFNQAFRDGIFHADLHPGNILINEQQQIILVDFGIIGFLDETSRLFVAEMLHAFIQRDYDRVARLHMQIGYLPDNESCELFALACRSIGEPILGLPVNQISIANLLKHLFEVSGRFNMKLQPQLILLQKNLLTVEGVGYSLYPEVNMWKLAEPWIIKWGKKNLSRMAKTQYYVKQSSKNLYKLPDLIDKAIDIIERTDHQLKRKKK